MLLRSTAVIHTYRHFKIAHKQKKADIKWKEKQAKDVSKYCRVLMKELETKDELECERKWKNDRERQKICQW